MTPRTRPKPHALKFRKEYIKAEKEKNKRKAKENKGDRTAKKTAAAASRDPKTAKDHPSSTTPHVNSNLTDMYNILRKLEMENYNSSFGMRFLFVLKKEIRKNAQNGCLFSIL